MNYNFQETPTLHTERLVIREANLKDIKSVFELRSSQEINKFVGTKRIESTIEAKDFIEACNALFQVKKRIFWLVEFNQQVIGSIVLHNINLDLNYAEIGYKLKSEYHQQGLMTEVLEKVIAFAEKSMKLKTLEAFTHKNNLASIALLKKINFVLQPERRCKTYDFNRIYKLDIK
jgi:ribosomal-protein-alanine N-acetyltransferase